MDLEGKLKTNAEVGADLVLKALKGETAMTDKIKLASMAITQHCKHIATKGAIDAIKFSVGRSISTDPAAMKDFIIRNMPEYVEVKKIGNK